MGILGRLYNFISVRLTLQRKMVLVFCFFLPIVIFLVGISITTWMKQYVRDSIIEKYSLLDSSVMDEITMLKYHDEQIFNSISSNKDVQEALSAPPPENTNEWYEQYRKLTQMLSINTTYDSITGIYLVGENGQSLRSSIQLADIAQSNPERFAIYYDAAVASSGKPVWSISAVNIFYISNAPDKAGPYIYMTRAFRTRISQRELLGVGIMRLSYRRYESMLSFLENYEGEYAALLDKNGVVLAHSSDRSILGTQLEPAISGYVTLNNSNHQYIDELKGVVISTGSVGKEWTLVHFIPNGMISDTFSRVHSFIWTVMILSFLAMMTALTLFARLITKPIRHLSISMRRFGEGAMDVRIHSRRHDEIGELQWCFNRMADNLNTSVRLMEENLRIRAKLEMDVLENQINPHFLYNALDLINWKAHRAGQEDISEMTAYLAQFFRLGLHMGHEYVKAADEVAHARAYLEICKMRYGDALSFEFDVDESLLEVKIKKIILQPLIENCIKYGLKKDTNENRIGISVYREGETMVLSVSDNGSGMDEQRLRDVLKRITSDEYTDETGSFGLHNLYSRLVLAYKGNCTLNVESSPGQGTVVTVRIPLDN